MSLLLAKRRPLLFPSAAAAVSYADEVLADSPFAYWRFEETSGATVADEGGVHDGTMFGANLAMAGRQGSAVSFDGTDDYIDVGTLGTFGSGMEDFAAELWMRSTETAAEVMFGTINAANLTSVALWQNYNQNIENDPGNLLLFIRNDTNNVLFCGPTTNPGVNDGSWHHIVVNKTLNDIEFWIDGVSVTLSGSGGMSTFSDYIYSMMIGARNDEGAARFFSNVDIDEFALYSSPLTGARIAAHYNAGVA